MTVNLQPFYQSHGIPSPLAVIKAVIHSFDGRARAAASNVMPCDSRLRRFFSSSQLMAHMVYLHNLNMIVSSWAEPSRHILPQITWQKLSRGVRARRGQPTLHLLVVDHASLLHHRASTREHHKIRDPTHIEATCHFRITLRVDLHHDSAPSHL